MEGPGPQRHHKRAKRKPWRVEEDQLLAQLVALHGTKKWMLISSLLSTRDGKQCRERWHNQLDPAVVRGPWTEQEEVLLQQAHMKYGNKWSKIAAEIPGRTDNDIKNHWNSAARKKSREVGETYREALLHNAVPTESPLLLVNPAVPAVGPVSASGNDFYPGGIPLQQPPAPFGYVSDVPKYYGLAPRTLIAPRELGQVVSLPMGMVPAPDMQHVIFAPHLPMGPDFGSNPVMVPVGHQIPMIIPPGQIKSQPLGPGAASLVHYPVQIPQEAIPSSVPSPTHSAVPIPLIKPEYSGSAPVPLHVVAPLPPQVTPSPPPPPTVSQNPNQSLDQALETSSSATQLVEAAQGLWTLSSSAQS